VFDGRWRTNVERGVKPVGSAIRRTGITADHLTATGLVVAALTAIAVGTGHLLVGFVLLVLAAIPDLLDGAVAKASGTASPRGAFFDSVADRVTDALLLGGIAWHLAASRGGLLPLLPMAVLGVSMLVSYERAKAESLGFDARGGLMERAERIIAMAAGLAFPFVLVPVLWGTLVLTSLTAVQRFVKVWRQASAPRIRYRERVQVAQRWRAWRESTITSERVRARRATRERPRRSSRTWRHTQGSRRP
jgi:CDP-diacylglycerol--glycerol-3-phosphate 3-phosphatidyltransferase